MNTYPAYQYYKIDVADGRTFWIRARKDLKNGGLIARIVDREGNEGRQTYLLLAAPGSVTRIREAEEDRKYGTLRISKPKRADRKVVKSIEI